MKLSVAFPTFNRAGYLRRAVMSFVDQLDSLPTGVRVELTIHDNASSDETPAVCSDLIDQFPFIVLVRHPSNIGADANIHQALLAGSGEFVWVFGDDDYLKPGALRLVCEALSAAPALLRICGEEERDVDGEQGPRSPVDVMATTAVSRSFNSPDEVLKHFGLSLGNFTKTIFSRSFIAECYVKFDDALFESGYSQLAWMYAGLVPRFDRISELQAKVVVIRIELSPRGLAGERMRAGLQLLKAYLIRVGYSEVVVDEFFRNETNAVILGQVKINKIGRLPVRKLFWQGLGQLNGSSAKVKFLVFFFMPGTILKKMWMARV